MDNLDLCQLGPRQLGPILMQTQPLSKTPPHQVDPFFICFVLSMLHIYLKRQICKEMALEGSTNDGYIIKGITNVFDIKHSS